MNYKFINRFIQLENNKFSGICCCCKKNEPKKNELKKNQQYDLSLSQNCGFILFQEKRSSAGDVMMDGSFHQDAYEYRCYFKKTQVTLINYPK
jgi:hypothetical protein